MHRIDPHRKARSKPRTALALLLLAAATAACSAPSSGAKEQVAAAPGSTAVAKPTSDTVEVVTSRTTMHIAAMKNGTPPALPDGASPFEVDFKGHKIRGIDIPGPGPAVVLTHGFPDNLHLYDRLYPLLAGKREVVAFDWIGWGLSDKPAPKEFPQTTAVMTDEFAAVMQARKLDGATLVVHDASGPPGIDYAMAHPSSVGKLVVLNTYYALASTLRPPEAILFAADPHLQDSENALEADPAVVQELYHWQLRRFVSTTSGANEFIDHLYSEFPEARPAFVALNDVLFDEVGARRSNQLSGLTMPVAIVWGTDDPYLTSGVAQDFKDHIPGATLELVPKSNHFIQFDTPDRVAAAIGVT